MSDFDYCLSAYYEYKKYTVYVHDHLEIVLKDMPPYFPCNNLNFKFTLKSGEDLPGEIFSTYKSTLIVDPVRGSEDKGIYEIQAFMTSTAFGSLLFDTFKVHVKYDPIELPVVNAAFTL